MNKELLDSVEELGYAHLGVDQENKLREMEKEFNNEFRTDYYFMVMKKDKE